jgi:hypothetical protein
MLRLQIYFQVFYFENFFVSGLSSFTSMAQRYTVKATDVLTSNQFPLQQGASEHVTR